MVSENFDKLIYNTYDSDQAEDIEFTFDNIVQFKESAFYLGSKDSVSPYAVAQQEFCLKEAMYYLATGGEK